MMKIFIKIIILLTLWEQNIRMMNMNLTILMQLLPNFKMTNSPLSLTTINRRLKDT